MIAQQYRLLQRRLKLSANGYRQALYDTGACTASAQQAPANRPCAAK
jgi:hypothetical protein